MYAESLVFWIALALLAYTYLGYPLLMWLAAFLWRCPHARSPIEPTVSILVVAHNEAERIEERITDLLALDYPPELLEIVIASDASADATAALARRLGGERLRVVEFREHRGKPAVLNDLIPGLQGEIAVLMDVRQRIDRAALRELVSNFADPEIGAVSGELMLTGGGNESQVEGVGFYWRYEKHIRINESLTDSTVGTSGALYALRSMLFRPIPEDTLLDDVLIPMEIVRQGYRVIFEPGAKAFDRIAGTARAEYIRKVRTISGNFQLLFRQPWLLNPFQNRLWFQTVSHKLCRLLSPFCLGLLLAANLALFNDGLFYRIFLVLQILFYLAAGAGHGTHPPANIAKALNIPHAFCLLNWATLVGFMRFVLKSQQVTWQKAK